MVAGHSLSASYQFQWYLAKYILNRIIGFIHYQLFKSINDKERLMGFVRACLQFGKFQNSGNEEKEIANRATDALKRITKESKINELRVKAYGIIIQLEKWSNRVA